MRLSVDSLRRVVKRDLAIEFVLQQLTSFGGLEVLRRYAQRLALPARLRHACAPLGGDYSGASLGLLILALLYAGARRLELVRGVLFEDFGPPQPATARGEGTQAPLTPFVYPDIPQELFDGAQRQGEGRAHAPVGRPVSSDPVGAND